MILGPLLGANFGTSVGLIHHLMTGQFRGIPRFGFSVVDVRDAAQAHLLAMTKPAAKDQRFIVGGSFFWLRDLVAVLAASFRSTPPGSLQARCQTRLFEPWRKPIPMLELSFMNSIAT